MSHIARVSRKIKPTQEEAALGAHMSRNQVRSYALALKVLSLIFMRAQYAIGLPSMLPGMLFRSCARLWSRNALVRGRSIIPMNASALWEPIGMRSMRATPIGRGMCGGPADAAHFPAGAFFVRQPGHRPQEDMGVRVPDNPSEFGETCLSGRRPTVPLLQPQMWAAHTNNDYEEVDPPEQTRLARLSRLKRPSDSMLSLVLPFKSNPAMVRKDR